jgi:hypothetical protein
MFHLRLIYLCCFSCNYFLALIILINKSLIK